MRIRHIKGAEEAVAASIYTVSDPSSYKGRWAGDVFGNDAPVCLEVGMGMGAFIREQSFAHDDISFIGIEINTTVLYKAIRRYESMLREKAGSRPARRNLRFIRSDARFLGDYFAEDEISCIYLNFSDPWPKDKNAGKRLTAPGFLRIYSTILGPEGTLEFKTDNEALFDYSLGSLTGNGWDITVSSRDLHSDPVLCKDNIMTEYEAKFSAKGNPIYKLTAKQKSH